MSFEYALAAVHFTLPVKHWPNASAQCLLCNADSGSGMTSSEFYDLTEEDVQWLRKFNYEQKEKYPIALADMLLTVSRLLACPSQF